MNKSDKKLKSLHPFAELDRAIHAPARLMMMCYLYAVKKADFVFLLQLTGLTWGNLSSHLSTLEESGYITIEKTFIKKKPNSLVNITDIGRKAFKQYKGLMLNVLNEL